MSVDQSVVDLDIPFRLGGFASTTIQLIGIVGVMTQVTWQILLLVIPMAIACLWMQVKYGLSKVQAISPLILTIPVHLFSHICNKMQPKPIYSFSFFLSCCF